MSARASWGLTAGLSTGAFGRAGSTTKLLSRCARTSAIIPLRPRIPLAPGAVPASDSALRMPLPQPPGRSSRLSAAPAGESWLRRLSMGPLVAGLSIESTKDRRPCFEAFRSRIAYCRGRSPGKAKRPPHQFGQPCRRQPHRSAKARPVRYELRTEPYWSLERHRSRMLNTPGCTRVRDGWRNNWRRWGVKIGRGFPQNEPNPAKWRRAIAKETEPRYPSLRCVLRYRLAMPPPAYPVAVPMPAAPVAHTAAVAMVPMLDE